MDSLLLVALNKRGLSCSAQITVYIFQAMRCYGTLFAGKYYLYFRLYN